MNNIDLHCHTTASDGILAPGDLLSQAHRDALGALAICDHDTVDGVDEAIEANRGSSMVLVPGIEFSIESTFSSFHLLGLFIDHKLEELTREIDRLTEERDSRARKIVLHLNSHGFDIDYGEVEEEAGKGAVGRPHIARVLAKHGYGESVRDIFQNFMIPGRPGYIKKEKITFSRAVALITESGGCPVVAHPVTLGLNSDREAFQVMEDFAREGVRGIEVYSNLHDQYMVELYRSIALELGLYITGGSDFHGDQNEKLGYYGDNRPLTGEVETYFKKMLQEYG